jgi:hypothetical protein
MSDLAACSATFPSRVSAVSKASLGFLISVVSIEMICRYF